MKENNIRRYLNQEIKDMDIEIHKILKSTNDTAKQQASSDDNVDNKVVIALSQTGGKGRLGRSFFSPDDTGIYMTIIVRPDLTVMESTMLTTSAVVAVVEAIKKVTKKDSKIKWVNDIYMEGKKICGILTEASMCAGSTKLKYAVVGIGINVFNPDGDFPEDIKNIASAIYKKGEKADIDVKERIVAEVLNKFFEYYKDLKKKTYVEKYKKYSFVIGKDVTIVVGDEKKNVNVLDIDDDCRLKVRYENGEEKLLSSGEITLKI